MLAPAGHGPACQERDYDTTRLAHSADQKDQTPRDAQALAGRQGARPSGKPPEKGLDNHEKPLENEKGLPAHPVEPTYPCCLSALGEFGQVPPRGEPCIHTRAPPNPPPNQPAVFEPHSCPDSWIGALRESTPVSRSLNGAAQRRGCQTLIPAQAVVRPHDRCHERVTSSAGSELGMWRCPHTRFRGVAEVSSSHH